MVNKMWNIRPSWILFSIGAALLMLIASCGTTKLTATWYDTDYGMKGSVQDVLVIAVSKEETTKRLYEDLFVEKLKASGVNAIASYTLSQPNIPPEQAAVAEAVSEAGASTVLITRHLGTDSKQHYRPPERLPLYADPYYSRMHGYYPMAYREVYSPGYTVTVTTVFLESNLYDAASGALIWSARSESVNPQMSKAYIEELVEVFSKDLKDKGLL